MNPPDNILYAYFRDLVSEKSSSLPPTVFSIVVYAHGGVICAEGAFHLGTAFPNYYIHESACTRPKGAVTSTKL